MTDYQTDMEALRRAMEDDMGDETTAPEIKVGQAIRAVQAAIDDLIILANVEETRALVCREKVELGTAHHRIETLCRFALAVRPAPTLVRRAS